MELVDAMDSQVLVWKQQEEQTVVAKYLASDAASLTPLREREAPTPKFNSASMCRTSFIHRGHPRRSSPLPRMLSHEQLHRHGRMEENS